MCPPHSRKVRVIIVGGKTGVFPIQYDGRQRPVPPLDKRYIGERLRPDAKEKLLEMLDDIERTM